MRRRRRASPVISWQMYGFTSPSVRTVSTTHDNSEQPLTLYTEIVIRIDLVQKDVNPRGNQRGLLQKSSTPTCYTQQHHTNNVIHSRV